MMSNHIVEWRYFISKVANSCEVVTNELTERLLYAYITEEI